MNKAFAAFCLAFLVLLPRISSRAGDSDPSVGRWISVGNGPAHSGYYPATLGNGPAVAGWTRSFAGQPLNQVAVSDGRVFVTANGNSDRNNLPPPLPSPTPFALALDAATGAELWRYPTTRFFESPSVADGSVFFATGDLLVACNVQEGTPKWTHTDFGSYGPPVVVGDRLWANGANGVVQLRLSDNRVRYSASLFYPGYGCRVSFGDGVVYINDPKTFFAVDAESGGWLWTIPTSTQGSLLDPTIVPAIAGGKATFIADSSFRLVTVDLKTRKVLWSLPGTYPGYQYPPATDGAVVYAIVAKGLNAYAADTGQLLRRYDFPSPASPSVDLNFPPRNCQPIVTNDSVIVGTHLETYILDKATLALRQRLPVGGYLSYAGGILYVANIYGVLNTFHFPDAAEPSPAPWPAPTPPQPEPKGNIELATMNYQGTGTANGYSQLRGFSNANGRYVLFASKATDLTNIPDNNGQEDLFVRDLQTRTTELVTVNASGTAAGNATGFVDVQQACMTPDGRFVAFDSPLTDLDPADTNGPARDVFVRDLQQHKTTLISVSPDGAAAGGFRPFISADGRYVLFSGNEKLAPGDVPPNTTSLYVRDRQTNVTTRVSLDSSGAPLINAFALAFTRNGRFLLFKAAIQTSAGSRTQLFLRDLQSKTTQLVTVTISGQPATSGSIGNARLSEDGRFVVFDSTIPDLVAFDPNTTSPTHDSRDVFVRDTVAGTTTLINWEDFGDAILADISADGMVIGFFGNPYPHQSLYVCDRRTGITSQLVPGMVLAGDAAGTTGIRIDPTGRFVFYHPLDDVYVFDRQLRTKRLISHNFAGTGPGNGKSALGDITDDAQTVVFQNYGTDLVNLPDFNNSEGQSSPDIFVSTTETSGALLNISTRGDVRADDNTLIGGFVVAGTASKKVMIRGLGPSLQALGISNAVSDPTIDLYNGTGALLASNDNWKTNQSEIEATGIPPSHDLESALVRSLTPGAYTVVMRGNGGGAGTGLIELYDLENSTGSRLADISTRGFVGSGDNAMIAGFIAGGGDGGGAAVLVRGLGPTLSNFGVAGALQDPMLELRDPNGTLVGSNDDWRATQAAEIQATGIPPNNDSEAAILAKLAPGPYTAIIRGKNASTGVATVEVYHFN